MQFFSADGKIFFDFFSHENMKNHPLKVLIIDPYFCYCQQAQNHPKSQSMFHKDCSPHGLSIMTLSVSQWLHEIPGNRYSSAKEKLIVFNVLA